MYLRAYMGAGGATGRDDNQEGQEAMRRRWLLGGLVLLSPLLLAADWESTTNYETRTIAAVVRAEQLQEALRQFIGETTCTGVSTWRYEIYLDREDIQQPGHWVTDEQPTHTGRVKLCKAP